MLLPLALWSIPALLMILQMQASAFIDHRPFYGFRDTMPAIAEWLVWVPVTPIVLSLARRFPLWPRASVSALFVHAAGIVGATMVRATVYSLTTAAIGKFPAMSFSTYWVRICIGWLPSAALVYGAIALTSVALHYARRVQRGELRAAELEASLARAESASLRAQLDPHFLFNSLHSVGALVRSRDADGALQMLSDLGDLLRTSLSRRTSDESTVAEEIEFAKRYLSIEQVRLQDRLVVNWNVSNAALDAVVPRLVLQPIVENAVRHGIARRTASGSIRVGARRTDDSVILTVQDDGPGFDSSHALVDGIGLSSARVRLQALYGSRASLAIHSPPPAGAVGTAGTVGTLVAITLPYKRAVAAAPTA